MLPSLNHGSCRISDLMVSTEGIFNCLLQVDTRKSSDPDGIPNAFFRRYAEWCSKSLYVIYSCSLKTCDVPQDWKLAKVVPIYIKGEKKILLAITDQCHC